VKTRSDDGQPVTNFAGLLGPLAGEALANTYYPEGSRGVGDTFIRYSADLGWRFAGNLLKQYWPDINKKLRLTPAVPARPRAESRTRSEPLETSRDPLDEPLGCASPPILIHHNQLQVKPQLGAVCRQPLPKWITEGLPSTTQSVGDASVRRRLRTRDKRPPERVRLAHSFRRAGRASRSLSTCSFRRTASSPFANLCLPADSRLALWACIMLPCNQNFNSWY
jgi:hypothetical protein